MATIIGKVYTPYDEDKQRDVVHYETEVDAVLDPVTGKPLREQLKDITDQLVNVDAGDVSPHAGFITPEQVQKYDNMVSNSIVISPVKPATGTMTMWYRVYNESLTTSEPVAT